MVYALLNNKETYRNLSPAIGKALDYLAEQNLTALEDGRHEIEGDNIFALVSSPTTRPWENTPLEAHRQYLDLHYVYEGRELVYVALVDGTQTLVEENWEQDYALYKGEATPLPLGNGQFLLLWPEDLHAPLLQQQQPEKIRKIVIKIKLA